MKEEMYQFVQDAEQCVLRTERIAEVKIRDVCALAATTVGFSHDGFYSLSCSCR